MYYCYIYDVFGCAWVVIRQKQLRSYDAFLANLLGCIIYFEVINMTPCAKVGSKPCYRCGCTGDIHCRLGDAGSMTFLPWFVPRTKPPVQLREVGPDRRHLLSESCSDVHLYVCQCRTGDEDSCCCCSVGSRRQNVTSCTGVIFAR